MTARNRGSALQAETAPGATATGALATEVLFREVNERIAELTESFMDDGAKLFVCECSRPDCIEALELTRREYELVRVHGSRFVVVEKAGEARQLAIAADRERR